MLFLMAKQQCQSNEIFSMHIIITDITTRNSGKIANHKYLNVRNSQILHQSHKCVHPVITCNQLMQLTTCFLHSSLDKMLGLIWSRIRQNCLSKILLLDDNDHAKIIIAVCWFRSNYSYLIQPD